jgi:O-antigen ligase
MLFHYNSRVFAGVTAAVVTTATFGKTFVPFYLIGSTAIFAATSALGAALIVINWRSIYDMTGRVADILLVLAAFYGLVITSFLFHSRPAVPTTHLLGILVFHATFLIFGFAAARALRATLLTISAAAAIYSILIIQHIVRFGDVMRDNYLHDIFGIGNQVIFTTFHQNIGPVLGLGLLAAIGLASPRINWVIAFGAVPIALLFMFHIAARGALVALLASLAFLGLATLWVRSKMAASLSVVALFTAVTIASGVFYERALDDKVDPAAPDAISRTIREFQNPDPGFRMQIWAKTWRHIVSEPDQLLFGRGIGMYPVNEGFGAPDWLLHRTEGAKHYPHNVHLEILYETGITGLLLFSILTLFPLVTSLRRWHLLLPAEKSTVSIYVFNLVSSEISGAFAFSYVDPFFFALTVGIIALKRTDDVVVPSPPSPEKSPDQRHSVQVRF